MPIIKSAAKRMRQDTKKTRVNNRYRREMRNKVKAVLDAISAGDKKSAEGFLPAAQKAIDKAVRQGVIHKNTAARKKSSLSRKLSEAAKTKATDAKTPAKKTTAKKTPAKKAPAKKAATSKKTTKK